MLGRSDSVLAHGYSLPAMPSFSMSATLPVQVRRLFPGLDPVSEVSAAGFKVLSPSPDSQPDLVLLHAARQPRREWAELRDVHAPAHAASPRQPANGVVRCDLDR